MNILCLNSPDVQRNEDPIYRFLREQKERVKEFSLEFTELSAIQIQDWQPDLTVSFNYHYRVPKAILDECPAVNLHISYMPWNRGCHPNFWAAWEGTINGVSVHYMDEGFDSGNLISRREVEFTTNDTLRTSHAILEAAVIEHFKSLWSGIRDGSTYPGTPCRGGTYHTEDAIKSVLPIFPKGWDTPVWQVRALGAEYRRIAVDDHKWELVK